MTFACPTCSRESHHPIDDLVGWCAACARFTRDSPLETALVVLGLRRRGQHDLADAIARRARNEGHVRRARD